MSMQTKKALSVLFTSILFLTPSAHANEFAPHISGAQAITETALTDFEALQEAVERQIIDSHLSGSSAPFTLQSITQPQLGATHAGQKRTLFPSELIERLDITESPKAMQKRSLKSAYQIENSKGLMMHSLTVAELQKANFPISKQLAAIKFPHQGIMLSPLPAEALQNLNIVGATEIAVSPMGSDSRGAYVHPSLSLEHKNNPPGIGTPYGTNEKQYLAHANAGKEGHEYKSEGSKSHHGGGGHKSYTHKGSHGESYSHGKSYGSKHSHGGKFSSPFMHVLASKEELGLTDAQIDQINDAEFEYKKVTMRAETEHDIAHMELDRLVHSGDTNETRIRELADLISQSKSKKIHAMAEAKISILKILSAEQRKKVSEMHRNH